MKNTLNDHIQAYKKQMEIGHIQQAYRGLLEYMMGLRTHFLNEYPDGFLSGSFHPGYMDITYFPFTPRSLARQKLKIAIVLNHEYLRFEIWLAGNNRQIQKKYWEIFKGSDWNKYHIPETVMEGFSIVDHILVEAPDFTELPELTKQVESGAMKFIEDIVAALE